MTNKPTILVTSAAGKTGKAVAHQLLEKGYPVNAHVRRQDHRSEALARAGAKSSSGTSSNPTTFGKPCTVCRKPTTVLRLR